MDTKGLKVGDKVLRRVRGGHWTPDTYYEGIITHVSPSGRVGIGTHTFNPNGYERGRSVYEGNELLPFDQTVLDKQAHQKMITKKRFMLEDTNWRNGFGSDEFILQIAALVDAERERMAPAPLEAA